jgi:hypothetical protein
MNGEERGQRGEKQFAAVLNLCQGDDADSAQNSAPNKVRCGRETHGALLRWEDYTCRRRTQNNF